MSTLGHINAVLAGKALPYAHQSLSAINKKILSGRHYVSTLGLLQDEQGDPRFHGGLQKALHIYPSEHYAFWQQILGPLPVIKTVGAFGENLSSSGVTESTICLNDKIRIGSTLLEVSQGRMPCWKLNVRFDQHDMAKKLQDTLKTGWYFRVLEEGEIGVGDEIILCERLYPEWSIATIMRIVFEGSLDRQKLEQLLSLPLVDSWRKVVEQRLHSGQLEDWSPRLIGPTA
ncbi:MOSC domain-containing protein [Vibrio azureus]|uniref:MOSC domain-containing protein n=1 Tax=Vibrio azureus NBRC 104587 TaxID=1219077 RepID=U3AU33_9VIBR|nr:MOSC domain-containing protein [Vibrio azureus]AUI87504.1 MOSC domain-containing protein [Vibrio azureus]GAD77255.1 hypothetical protein VAZ01S_069_00030 [Vibrio azureus NBRC 104587]